MEILYYVLTVCTALFLSFGALGKKYSKAPSAREKFLNISAFSLSVALAMWIAFAFSDEKINIIVFVYSAVFAVNFIVCNFALYAAMEQSSLSIVNLINALSLVIPTLAGIVFWNEQFNTWLLCAAMVFMIGSLLLILLKKESVADGGAESAVKTGKAKLIVFNVVAFVTNGLSSVIQKSEQIAMDGQGVFSMTALSFSLVTVFAFLVYLVYFFIERDNSFKKDFIMLFFNKKSILLNAAGIGLVNLAVTFLATRVAGVFLYPCVLGGSVIVTTLFSAFLLKEKISLRMAAGAMLGVAAIVMFSL